MKLLILRYKGLWFFGELHTPLPKNWVKEAGGINVNWIRNQPIEKRNPMQFVKKYIYAPPP